MHLFKQLSIKEISIITILLYGLTFFSPIFFLPFSKEWVTPGITFTYILGAILMVLLYVINKSSAKTSIENEQLPKSHLYSLVLGIIGIGLSLLLQSALLWFEHVMTGVSSTSENTQSILKIILANPLFVLATTIGAPIMEEFVFRRSLLGLFAQYTGFWIASVCSSVLFSLLHRDGHFFVYFFLGLFFMLLYRQTRIIWTPIITHCGMNTVVLIIQLLLR